MANFSATLKSKDIDKFILKMQKQLRFPAKILRKVSNIFAFKDIIDHFRREKGPKKRWQKRSDFTQQIYKQIQIGAMRPPEGQSRSQFNPANAILKMTGTLRKSLLGGNAKIKGRDAVILSSNVDYSGKHDKGTGFGKGKIPPRPFMWLSNKAKSNMLNAMLRMVMGKQ